MTKLEACYLLHFAKPVNGQQHYIGYTRDLPRRFLEHCSGKGSRVTRAACREGVRITLVAVWPGGRKLEAALKRQHNAKSMCPVCQYSLDF